MEKLISKLQYKTCEKGEYYEEKERNLEETILLIKNFPWTSEQYAEIDLTGPSVTIEDTNGNFFRVGIYYGMRHSLYYSGKNNIYFECFPVDLECAYYAVEEFFKDNIDFKSFEKYSFSYSKRAYFKSKNFEYKNSLWKAFFLNIFWMPLILTFIGFLIVELMITPIAALVFGLPPICIFLYFVGFSLYRYYKRKTNILKYHGAMMKSFMEVPLINA